MEVVRGVTEWTKECQSATEGGTDGRRKGGRLLMKTMAGRLEVLLGGKDSATEVDGRPSESS